MMDVAEKKARLKSAQINNALGMYILLFGLVVVFTTSLSETPKQRAVSLISGGVMVLIGGGMAWYARRNIRVNDLKSLNNSNDS